MLGIKKKDKKEIPVPKPPENIDAKVVEAKILSQDKTKLLEWIMAEYKEQYLGIFTEKDLEQIDQEATSLNILFAIYGELRILRTIMEKDLKS